MKPIRKSLVCLFGALALASCSASESVDVTKKTLEAKSYSVSVYDYEGYKKLETYKAFTDPQGLTNHLTALKKTEDNNETFFVWYFGSIDQASAWQEANMASLARFYDAEKGNSMGTRNNTVWVGAVAIADLLSWRGVA